MYIYIMFIKNVSILKNDNISITSRSYFNIHIVQFLQYCLMNQFVSTIYIVYIYISYYIKILFYYNFIIFKLLNKSNTNHNVL